MKSLNKATQDVHPLPVVPLVTIRQTFKLYLLNGLYSVLIHLYIMPCYFYKSTVYIVCMSVRTEIYLSGDSGSKHVLVTSVTSGSQQSPSS